jgi:hypothetical protein
VKTFLFDDWAGVSHYEEAPNWEAAEELADENGLTLIGEHVPITEEQARAPLWLSAEETRH